MGDSSPHGTALFPILVERSTGPLLQEFINSKKWEGEAPAEPIFFNPRLGRSLALRLIEPGLDVIAEEGGRWRRQHRTGASPQATPTVATALWRGRGPFSPPCRSPGIAPTESSRGGQAWAATTRQQSRWPKIRSMGGRSSRWADFF